MIGNHLGDTVVGQPTLYPQPLEWGLGGCLQRGEYCVVMMVVLGACVLGLWV